MKRILIVDDEQNIREVLKEYLEFNGFEVITADDGYEAVDMCKREDYDFIVMDIMMPKWTVFPQSGKSARPRIFPLWCCRRAEKSTTSCSASKRE